MECGECVGGATGREANRDCAGMCGDQVLGSDGVGDTSRAMGNFMKVAGCSKNSLLNSFPHTFLHLNISKQYRKSTGAIQI